MHPISKALISTRFDADGVHVPDLFKDKVRLFLKDAGIPVLLATGDYADNTYAAAWMRLFCIPTTEELQIYYGTPSQFKYYGRYYQPDGFPENIMELEIPDLKLHTCTASVGTIVRNPKGIAERFVHYTHETMMAAKLVIPLPMCAILDAPDHSVVTVDLDELYLVRLQHYNENLPIDHVQPSYKPDLLLGHPVRPSVFQIDLH